MPTTLREPDRARENRALLAATYRRTYKYLYKEALSMVGSPETADEIVQEAFTVTAEKIDEGVEIENIGGWLKTVVRNQCTHHWRRKPTVSLDEDLGLVGSDSPDEIVNTRQRCQDVYLAVKELAPAQRSAFLLAELQGLDYREIASNLNRTEDAVRQLLARARRHIRENIGQDAACLTPILTQLEVEGLLRPDGSAFALRDRLAAKLAHLHAQVASLIQRTAEVLTQPAAALVAGAAVIVALGGLSQAERPVGLAELSAPQAASSRVSTQTEGSHTSSRATRSRQRGPSASARDRGPASGGRKGRVSTPSTPSGGGKGSVSPATLETHGTAGGHGTKSNSSGDSNSSTAVGCGSVQSNCAGNSSTEGDGEGSAGSERRQERRRQRRQERRQQRKQERRGERGQGGGEQKPPGGESQGGGEQKPLDGGAQGGSGGSDGQEGTGNGDSQGTEPPANSSEPGPGPGGRRRGRR